jgi:endonuclease-3
MDSQKLTEINKLLIEYFGVPPRNESGSDPVDMIIATILSQNTNDRNSFKAFQQVKAFSGDWNKIAALKEDKLEELIRPAGLTKQKGKAIKNVLTSLKKRHGKISLDYIKEMPNEAAISDLTKFDGVGVKTASCVLLFSLGRNVCPVDVHVHRTVNRILAVKTSSPDKTFVLINRHLPEGIAHSLHTNLIRLGRGICRPAVPNCGACPLLNICLYENKNLSAKAGIKKNDFMLLDNVKKSYGS